jgi:hypothetical protein
VDAGRAALDDLLGPDWKAALAGAEAGGDPNFIAEHFENGSIRGAGECHAGSRAQNA